MPMRFYQRNIIATSTELSTSSGGGNVANLIDRRNTTRWVSSGQSLSGTTATISWVAPSSTNVTNIMIRNHNWAAFTISYNSVATNVFSPSIASVTGFTNSNLMYSFNTQAVTSVQFHVTATHSTGSEKFAYELMISNQKIELNANPNADGYQPVKYKKGVEHELSDGGIVSVFLSQKFRASLDLGFVNTATYDSLTAIYNEHNDFIFVPFPITTYTTNWNGDAYSVNWTGDLDIDRFKDNTPVGYIGRISLAETPL